jgi:hypothetical protein
MRNPATRTDEALQRQLAHDIQMAAAGSGARRLRKPGRPFASGAPLRSALWVARERIVVERSGLNRLLQREGQRLLSFNPLKD